MLNQQSSGEGSKFLSSLPPRTPVVRLHRDAIFALTALLGLISLYHLAIQPALSELVTGVPFINSYGRQRMLSQRLTKGMLALQFGLDRGEKRSRIAEFKDSLKVWTEQHNQLMSTESGHLHTLEIEKAVDELDRHFQKMKETGEKFLSSIKSSESLNASTDSPPLRILTQQMLMEEPHYLQLMNQIVGWYELEVKEQVRDLRILGWVIFSLLVGTAVFLYFCIIAPAIRNLSLRYNSNLMQYQTLVESMNDGLALIDRVGRIHFANRRLANMLQVSLDKLQGERLDDFLIPSPGARSALMQGLSHHEPVEATFQSGNVYRPVQTIVRSQLIKSEENPGMEMSLIVLTDITDEKSTQERLKTLQEQLAHVNRLKTVGEMSASLAHELGQPLCAISAFVASCQNLFNSADIPAEQVQNQLHRIDLAATRAAEILRRFRSFGRQSSLQSTTLDFPSLVDEVQQLCGPFLNGAKVRLSIECPPDLPEVTGDPLMIQQVLINLIQNASQALERVPESRKTIQLKIDCPDPRETLQISVTDEGMGIPSENLVRLQQPFFTTRTNGLGLGLAICRTIIEDHEGHFRITSEEGIGTIVRISLPTETVESSHA